MGSALQIRRGPAVNLATATAALGEPLVTTDTHELYIGTGSGTEKYKISDVIFAAVAPAVIKEKIWVNTATNAISRASDDGLTWVAVSGGSGSGTLSADLTVYGVTQGSYTVGNVIPAGTSLEDVIKGMLQTIIPPTYQAPTLGLSGSAPTTTEAGTTITPMLTPSFAQRDGGAATLYTLKKDGVTMVTNPSPQAFGDVAYVLGDVSISYQATQTYDQGPVKNDNQGNAYPTGQIAAGSAVSNGVTYTGRRCMFYGADAGIAAPVNSAEVRFLAGKTLGPANGATFTMSIPAGSRRVVIAYPDTLQDLTSVKYVELGNGEVKDVFVKTLFTVEGAAGFTAIGYKIFSYVPAVPFGDAVTFNITL